MVLHKTKVSNWCYLSFMKQKSWYLSSTDFLEAGLHCSINEAEEWGIWEKGSWHFLALLLSLLLLLLTLLLLLYGFLPFSCLLRNVIEIQNLRNSWNLGLYCFTDGAEWDIRERKSTLWAKRPKNSPHSLSRKKEYSLSNYTNTFGNLDK